jgi:SAM-dependent methyltransferase/glycosyltransferase involved in cell wall biosynthesis
MSEPSKSKVPISVLIAARNEAKNLPLCLAPLRGWADEIVLVDSASTDGTAEVARSYGAEVVQFTYQGGWPKKRQATLESYPFRNPWILLLDADEILLEPIKQEIAAAVASNRFDGYWIRFEIYFLGRQLRHGDTDLWKLSLFRKGKGRYEKRLESQDSSMSDIEVHEHVVVAGNVGRLTRPVRHENINTLFRYIHKHNEYSNWEAKVLSEGGKGELQPTPWGNQAERRRWLKGAFLPLPGSPILFFFYKYLLRLGFLDGIPGLLYSCFQAIQLFHVKAKLFEIKQSAGDFGDGAPLPAPQKPEGTKEAPAAWRSTGRTPTLRGHGRGAFKLNGATPTASDVQALFNYKARSWQSKFGPAGRLSVRLEGFTARLCKLTPPPAGILDLGCGTGDMAAVFSQMGYRVTACDIACAMIDVARNTHTGSSVEWICLEPDWRVLPFADGSFDAVVASSVFEYLVDLQQTATELSRVLRPEGILLLTVPNPLSYVRKLEGWFRKMLTNHLLFSLLNKLPYFDSYAAYILLSRNRLAVDEWHSALSTAHFVPMEEGDFSKDAWRRQADDPLILLAVKNAPAGSQQAA